MDSAPVVSAAMAAGKAGDARQNVATTNRIDRMFAALGGRPALVLYVTAGYPDLAASERLAGVLLESADLLEIGIPFSDPLADGPVIQAASQVALQGGATVGDAIRLTARVRTRSEVPVALMTYYNPVLAYGPARFAADAADAGADGVIVPDLPPEEAVPLLSALRRHGLHLIPLVAPTSTDARLDAAGSVAGGFVYCVSRMGVTGTRAELAADLVQYLARVRRHTSLPRVVGFGISRPEQVAEVGRHAEGVVVASALVDLVARSTPDRREQVVDEAARRLKQAAHNLQ